MCLCVCMCVCACVCVCVCVCVCACVCVCVCVSVFASMFDVCVCVCVWFSLYCCGLYVACVQQHVGYSKHNRFDGGVIMSLKITTIKEATINSPDFCCNQESFLMCPLMELQH